MTVTNNSSKQTPQVMGTNYEYPFSLDVLLQDPTEEDAKKAIKVIILNKVTKISTLLEYGTDYSVTLNSDAKGGKVTVVDKKTSDYVIIPYREYSLTQNSDYKDFNSFPADTVEMDLDKTRLIDQQQSEALARALKAPITTDGNIDYTLPAPQPSTVIGYNAKGDALTTYQTLPEGSIDIGTLNDGDLARYNATSKQFEGGIYMPTPVNGSYMRGTSGGDLQNRTPAQLKDDLELDTIDLGTATSGTKTCSYMDAVYKLVANGAFTLALPTEAGATKARIIRIKLTMSSINSISWPASVKWADDTAPSLLSTTAIYVLTFITEDGGTFWEGSCLTFGA